MLLVTFLADEEEQKKAPEEIKKSLDDLVSKLDASKSSSESWDNATSQNRERWEELKGMIHERQKALKDLVREKKVGIIGESEFQEKYKKLQDELTQLEFRVYNLRLGTSVEM